MTNDIQNNESFTLINRKDYQINNLTIPDGTVTVYRYHPETHEYCGSFTAYRYGNDVVCDDISNLTLMEPKCNLSINFWNNEKKYGILKKDIRYTEVFDLQKNVWTYEEDHRHFIYKYDEETHIYIKYLLKDVYSTFNYIHTYKLPLEGDTPESPGRIMEELGPLPDGAIIGKLPSIDLIKKLLFEKIYKSFNSYMDQLFKCTMGLTDDEIYTMKPKYSNYNNTEFVSRYEIDSILDESCTSFNNYNNLYNIYISAIQQITIQEPTKPLEPYSLISIIDTIHGFQSLQQTMEYMYDVKDKYYRAQLCFATIRRIINKDITVYKDLYELYQKYCINTLNNHEDTAFETLIEKYC